MEHFRECANLQRIEHLVVERLALNADRRDCLGPQMQAPRRHVSEYTVAPYWLHVQPSATNKHAAAPKPCTRFRLLRKYK